MEQSGENIVEVQKWFILPFWPILLLFLLCF